MEKNTATKFTFGNYGFLNINLEFHANQTAIDWMKNLTRTYPNYNVIVTTHSYLNGLGQFGYFLSPNTPQWEYEFRDVLNGQPNVFLALAGHYVPTLGPIDGDEETAFNTQVGNRQEVFFNRQNADGWNGGNSVRIYTFNMSDPSFPVHARTFNLYRGEALTDELNDFTFANGLMPLNSTHRPTAVPIKTLAQTPTVKLALPTPAPTLAPARTSPTTMPTLPPQAMATPNQTSLAKPKPTTTLSPAATITPAPTSISLPHQACQTQL